MPKFYFNKTVTANNDLAFYNAGTPKYLSDFVMFGSANAAYVPCMYYVESAGGLNFKAYDARIANEGATDYSTYWLIPLPSVKGDLSLFIDDIKISLSAASVDDYITNINVYGLTDSGTTSLGSSATDLTTAGLHVIALSTYDVSTYHMIVIKVTAIVTNALGLRYSAPAIKCYYA